MEVQAAVGIRGRTHFTQVEVKGVGGNWGGVDWEAGSGHAIEALG